MLEWILVLVAALFIAILFYKQANEQIELLQLDSEREFELPNLLAERSPIILTHATTPALGTPTELEKRPRLTPYLSLAPHQISTDQRRFLATELGLDIWFEHTWLKKLTTPLTRLYTTPRSKMIIGFQGLQRSTAPITFFMPTQGTFSINLMTLASEPFLPINWNGRLFHSFTPTDTPLLNQVIYTELKVRKGHIVFLPPHILYDISQDTNSTEPAWGYLVELHHPISRAVAVSNTTY